jgi:hypothetical protein
VLDAALRATQNQQGSPGSAAAAAAAAEAALQACLSDGQEQPGGQQQQLPSLDGGMAAGTGSSLPHNSTGSTGRGAAPDTGAGTASSSSSLSALALCSPAAAAGGPLSSAPSDRQAAGVVLLAPPRSQQPSPAMVGQHTTRSLPASMHCSSVAPLVSCMSTYVPCLVCHTNAVTPSTGLRKQTCGAADPTSCHARRGS